jgi:hypothetical protein
MVALVTLCETYIGIEPHFNLWSYFFEPGGDRAQTRERWP